MGFSWSEVVITGLACAAVVTAIVLVASLVSKVASRRRG